MIVSSTGASSTWFSIFLEALVAATFGARCFFVMDLRATPLARRTFDFTFFAAARFAADLRSTLALALRCFEPFFRVAIFALAIALSYRVYSQTGSKQVNYHCSPVIRHNVGSAISRAHRAPRWRGFDTDRITARSQAGAEIPRSRWRVRLKKSGPSRASRKISAVPGQVGVN
jgi:hypothetical protein